MKYLNAIILVLIVEGFLCHAQVNRPKHLFRIYENSKFGFIDSTGTIIIKPVFHSAEEFSEGLAAARINGTYGYIDKDGKFVIHSKFDFANSFENGIARVFLKGKPYFIDKKGNVLFDHNYKSIREFGMNSFAIAGTQSDNFGVINKNGKLIVDTCFSSVSAFIDGISIVTGPNHYEFNRDNNKEFAYEIGVIDTLGSMIVNYCRYKYIRNFKNGFGLATLLKPINDDDPWGWSNEETVIDRHGRQRFIYQSKVNHFNIESRGFDDSVAIVEIYMVDRDTAKIRAPNTINKYMGVINTEGRVLFSDTNWKEITPFAFNRAFVQLKNRKWRLIDKSGKYVCDTSFYKVIDEGNSKGIPTNPFQKGNAFVELHSGWCLIDTNGRILTKPNNFDSVMHFEYIRSGNVLFLQKITVKKV